MKISVIVVTLNSGENLIKTIDNIEEQTYNDYEIIVKDGGSSDGSIEVVRAKKYDNLSIHIYPDKGIYDAMNQAVKLALGDYVIFINAGDGFYDNSVLEKMAAAVKETENVIAYGDAFFELSNSLSKAPKVITESVCYRNIPCHQAIFYSRDILLRRGFDISYRIRADYEHFLWAFTTDKIRFKYLDFPVCTYEGGGFSESKKNRSLDRAEYNKVVRNYIPIAVRFKNRLLLIVTLHKVRGAIAKNPATAKFYQKIKTAIMK